MLNDKWTFFGSGSISSRSQVHHSHRDALHSLRSVENVTVPGLSLDDTKAAVCNNL